MFLPSVSVFGTEIILLLEIILWTHFDDKQEKTHRKIKAEVFKLYWPVITVKKVWTMMCDHHCWDFYPGVNVVTLSEPEFTVKTKHYLAPPHLVFAHTHTPHTHVNTQVFYSVSPLISHHFCCWLLVLFCGCSSATESGWMRALARLFRFYTSQDIGGTGNSWNLCCVFCEKRGFFSSVVCLCIQYLDFFTVL